MDFGPFLKTNPLSKLAGLLGYNSCKRRYKYLKGTVLTYVWHMSFDTLENYTTIKIVDIPTPQSFLCPSEAPPHSSLPPVLSQHRLIWFPQLLTVCIFRVDVSGAIQSILFLVWLHAALLFWDQSMLLHMLIVHSFLLLKSIPYCGCATVCIYIYLLKDIMGASIFLAIKKLDFCMFNLHIDIGSLNKYWGGMAEYMVGVCLSF